MTKTRTFGEERKGEEIDDKSVSPQKEHLISFGQLSNASAPKLCKLLGKMNSVNS